MVPLVARLQGQLRRDSDQYAAWALALERLRDDWASGSGVDVGQLGDYLRDVPADQRRGAMVDLVAEHLQLAWRAGQGQLLEAYFPVLRWAAAQLASAATVPADLIEDEFLARHTAPHGAAPTVAEYERRFPARADVLRLLRRRHLAGGRFVKLAKRGQGACGEVWETFDRAEQTLVALKLPRADACDRRQILGQFAREARLTAALNHPGIINLRECGVDEPEPLYAMRLADGPCLTDEIRNYHHPLATRTPAEQHAQLERLLACLTSACDALGQAHVHGVVHGDLKPGNVVLESSGRAAILDWGLARYIGPVEQMAASPQAGIASCSCEVESGESHLTQPAPGPIAGTPDYMAPEQLAGAADERTDVFGLGGILYEILTGRAPHSWSDGLRPADWPRLVREAQIARPRRWNPAASRALQTICLKALARDPGQRYQSAAELAAEIRRHSGPSAGPGNGSLATRAWRALRTNAKRPRP